MSEPPKWITDRQIEIGIRIRQLRIGANLTQDEVIRRTGIPRNTFLRMERAETDSRLSWLLAVADAIGVPLADLVDVPGAPR